MNTLRQQRIEKLKEFLANDPEDSFTKFALALEYVNISEYHTALTIFEDLRKNDPDYIGLYYHLGKLYEVLDDENQAVITYKEGIGVARKANDEHAASELREALSELEIDE